MVSYDREWLRDYFTNHWKGRSLHNYKYTGWNLIDEVSDDEHVLDVGCGENPFKGNIKNVYGIDITDLGADEVVAIEDFYSEKKFDVAFCLGSINFGDDDLINKQIATVVMHMKPESRIYWRCNPGRRDHDNDRVNDVPFYRWSRHLMGEYAKSFGYEIVHMMDDNDRLYFQWRRKKILSWVELEIQEAFL